MEAQRTEGYSDGVFRALGRLRSTLQVKVMMSFRGYERAEMRGRARGEMSVDGSDLERRHQPCVVIRH